METTGLEMAKIPLLQEIRQEMTDLALVRASQEVGARLALKNPYKFIRKRRECFTPFFLRFSSSLTFNENVSTAEIFQMCCGSKRDFELKSLENASEFIRSWSLLLAVEAS